MAIDAGRLEALRNIAAMQGRAISPEELIGAGVPWQEVQNYGGSSLPGPVQGVNFQELDRILNAAATSGKQISREQWASVGGPSHLYSYLYGEPPVDPGRVNRTTNDPLAGVPTYPIPSETVTGAFGKEATPNVQSLDEIYRSLMPLVQLNTAPQAEQELALKNLQGITTQDAATARQGDIAGRALWDKAMGGDPRQEQALDDLNRMFQQSRQYDPRIDDYISRLQTLSNEGLNAGERTAIREDSFRGMDSEAEQALRALALRNAGSGVRGGAETIGQRDVLNTSMAARKDLERQLLLADNDVRFQALKDYGTAVGGLDSELWGRQEAALKNYLTGAQGYNQGMATNSANALNTWMSGNAQSGDTLSKSARNYWDAATGISQGIDEKNLWNAQEQQKWASGRLGAISGGAGWWSAEDARTKQEEISKKMISAAEKGVSVPLGYPSGSTPTPKPFNDPDDYSGDD